MRRSLTIALFGMSDSSRSSSHQPDRASPIGYARETMESRLSLLQKEAEALDIDSITGYRSLRRISDALYALLTSTDVFGPWLAGRTLWTVQSRLDKACRWSVDLLELQTFDAELATADSGKIESIDRVRESIGRQFRRGKAKLSVATKELARPRFRDDVIELTTGLRWSGEGNEPGLETIAFQTMNGIKDEVLLTAHEGVPHFTTLHLLLLQLRRLRSVLDLFRDLLDRDACDRIQQELTRRFDQLEPVALLASVMIKGTRMMGNSTHDDEARALREFVPAATIRVEMMFDQLRDIWSPQFVHQLDDSLSSLLSHADVRAFASGDRAADPR